MVLAKQEQTNASLLVIGSLSFVRSLLKEQQALNVGQSNLFELDDLWVKFAERNGVFLQE